MHSKGDNMFLLSLVTPPESIVVCDSVPADMQNVRAPFIGTVNSEHHNKLGVSYPTAIFFSF